MKYSTKSLAIEVNPSFRSLTYTENLVVLVWNSENINVNVTPI